MCMITINNIFSFPRQESSENQQQRVLYAESDVEVICYRS